MTLCDISVSFERGQLVCLPLKRSAGGNLGGELVQQHFGLRRAGRRVGIGTLSAIIAMGAATVMAGSTPALASASSSSSGITTLFASDVNSTGGYGAIGALGRPDGQILMTMAYGGGTGPVPGMVAGLGPKGLVNLVGPGTTTIGTTPIPASSAGLEVPSGIVFDPTSNNYFIADAALAEVFEYSPTNDTIWLVAGGGSTIPSPTPTSATSVQLSAPWGLAVDGSGDLFISDGVSPFSSGNDEIDELTPSGDLSVIAGGGTLVPSTTPQSATTVQLAEPFGIASDGAGNLYVADAPDYVVEINTSTDELSVVAGGGTNQPTTTPQAATGVSLDGLSGVAIGPSGDVYVAAPNLNTDTSTLLDLSNGAISVVAGGGGVAPPTSGTIAPTSALLQALGGVTVGPDGQLYMTDVATGDLYGIGSAPTVTAVSPASGSVSGNNSVTITGSDLALATAVHFGKAAATIDNCTTTSCVVTAPKGSGGTVEVTVTTPFGTSPTSSATGYTYDAFSTATTLEVSKSSTRFGDEQGLKISVKVTSSSGKPTGTVTVAGAGCTIHLAAGAGSCTLGAKSLPGGVHSLVAQYGGSGSYAPSSSESVSLTVLKALTTTTLKATKSTLVFGKEQAGHLIVSVHSRAGAVRGTVSLSGVSCKKPLHNGTANCSLGAKALSIGTHTVTASFGGNEDFASSGSRTVTIVVKKAGKTARHNKHHKTGKRRHAVKRRHAGVKH